MRGAGAMSIGSTLSTQDVLAVFTEEIAARGGCVLDSFDDGERLFARSVLPQVEEVRPKDGFKGGVALRASRKQIWLYPYLFRLVCRNGAIMSEAFATRVIEDIN